MSVEWLAEAWVTAWKDKNHELQLETAGEVGRNSLFYKENVLVVIMDWYFMGLHLIIAPL